MRGGLLALALQLILAAAIRLQGQCPDGSSPPCRTAPQRSPPITKSLAVLYFENLSPDTADAYIAEGFSEQLTERLARIERLNVKSLDAVRRHQRIGVQPVLVARALGVSNVATGTIFPRPGGLRVTVELFNATSGTRLWSANYDRSTGDLIVIEHEIAREIAVHIAGQLLPAERTTIGAFPTRSPEAYDHFSRGQHLFNLRGTTDLLRALREFERAIAADSAFALAYARTAQVYGHLLQPQHREGSGIPAESLIARGVAAADRALDLDPSQSNAWLSRGRMLAAQYSPLYPGVLAAYERAIGLDPRNAEALNHYGTWMLLNRADLARARAAFERALEAEPDHGSALGNMVIVEFANRRFPEAERWADSALAVTHGRGHQFASRGMVRYARGDTAGARSDARASAAAAQLDWVVGLSGLLDLARGDTAKARTALDKLMARSGDPDGNRGLAVSALLIALGEPRQAVEYLERVRPQKGGGLPLILTYVFLDPIRSDPRFQKLVEESRP